MAWNNAATRLIFHEDFDRPPPSQPAPPPAPVEPVYNSAELREARAEALREGHAAGVAESDAGSVALARQALLAIAERLDTARAEATAIAEASAEAVATLVMHAFATAFPALCARHADTELRAIVRAVLPRLQEEPVITVRVDPHMSEALTQEISALDPDLLDRVRIIPTDAVPVGDLRIVWRAGGARRDTASLWTDIENVLAPAGLLSAPAGVEHTRSNGFASMPATQEIEHVQ